MFLRRAAPALTKRVVFQPAIRRSFAVSARKWETKANPKIGEPSSELKPFEGEGRDGRSKMKRNITSERDLMPQGGKPGTIPTDLEQATGLERLEILGKMQGVDVFDMRPLDASRKGTLEDPIIVKSFGDEQYIGCTGYPVDSHVVIWLTTSRDRPIERCPECGSVYKMEYVGPQDDGHGHHDDHGHADTDGSHNFEGEPKTMADFIKPEYR
ncbi:Cytochrome c oxidase subunit 4, mitochondrial [Fulvia fulva]|uniref:Cytochrome c oxidase subunit 4, mitochondrial n=1 Tax=Passalora fulva TaxID=5499 RepID=A0A9Q8LGH9_PASFU|nr:Cytochrome c oxidase subunit 4, mitochondrial [Fulvia fulva]KAK4627186.1 Cytochrome c oxidase subunit 4, mitochondrial [Fulvia fulva]KAK4627866.1 Cytochrome c oxidase subunit 4, mitochondrial [Fulvia fulva]UJO16193.1 Cytochrome c oxidase subunit 4, mitochondrial [Fulvia fulva]WPV13747.1 Cytochrome c oxidase subunit 4, mitochondrial [Fulvia fulva]WPV28918.1 Cytochrome c oxidase subunit 4, mitochondrial [Fulvia fulva]